MKHKGLGALKLLLDELLGDDDDVDEEEEEVQFLNSKDVMAEDKSWNIHNGPLLSR